MALTLTSAARGAKAAELARKYVRFGNKFEVVTISDITTDQFPEALRNIDAVIHTASPLPGRQAPEAIFSVRDRSYSQMLR